jgi:outer membrane receptor protein involved in Fe transport
VNEQAVNDDLVVTRFQGFFKANGMASYRWTNSVSLLLRVENLFNQRDLGYSRSVLGADGSTQRVAGVQRDPGTIVGGGVQVRF